MSKQGIQNTVDNLDSKGLIWTERKFKYPEAKIRIGTLFSGIGAIEQALNILQLNYKIQFAGDIDKNCKKAYFSNYQISEENWHDDVCSFNASKYRGKIDLLVGGAPCQAFSIRGKRGGFEDTRGTLFSEFARVVLECKPKIFIFENVKGMINHDKGKTWETIRKTFEVDCEYDIHFQILNGKDYGIPQNRERLFCIGFIKKTEFKFPYPIKLEKTIFDFLENEIPQKYFLKEKGVNFITRTINRKKSYTQINGNIQLCQKRNQQFNWHGDFIYYSVSKRSLPKRYESLVYRIEDLEESYYTKIPLALQMSEKEDIFISQDRGQVDRDFGMFRKLTPRECLRLMGFGESFKIVCSDTETYKQAGNSIIVNVFIALMKQLDITIYGEK